MTNNGLINPIWACYDWLIIDRTANHCVCFSLSLQKPVMTQGSWGGGWASCDVLTVCETKEIHIYNSWRCWEDGSTHIYFVNCFLVFCDYYCCYFTGLDPNYIYIYSSCWMLHIMTGTNSAGPAYWCTYN